jgi:hypothetical protein
MKANYNFVELINECILIIHMALLVCLFVLFCVKMHALMYGHEIHFIDYKSQVAGTNPVYTEKEGRYLASV